MKTIAVEKLKYELHQEFLKENFAQEMKKLYETNKYWKEIGAFTCVSPRRSGKTTLIKKLSNELLEKNEQVLILTYTIAQANELISNFKQHPGLSVFAFRDQDQLRGINFSRYNLFIDEFLYIDSNVINSILNYQWLSVNLFSSLK